MDLIVIILLIAIVVIKHKRKVKQDKENILRERNKAIDWYREQMKLRKKNEIN